MHIGIVHAHVDFSMHIVHARGTLHRTCLSSHHIKHALSHAYSHHLKCEHATAPFQLSGTKRFTLLPCEAHTALRLHPHWHGSNRQAQAPLPPRMARWEVELRPGELLFVPSRVFHQVSAPLT